MLSSGTDALRGLYEVRNSLRMLERNGTKLELHEKNGGCGKHWPTNTRVVSLNPWSAKPPLLSL